jgi:hypothetical protein
VTLTDPVDASELIFRKQRMMTYSLQIKDLPMLNSIMEFTYRLAAVFQLIYRKECIVTNSLPINDLPIYSQPMEFSSAIAMAC